MKEQVLTSPFVSKEFLNLAYNFSDSDKQLFNNCVINNKVVSNTGNRDFIDYRPEIAFTNEELHRNNVEKVMLDSLHYFQIKDGLSNLHYKEAVISKSDIAVTLPLASSYDAYLLSLSKKKRHELKRKKRNFEKEITDGVLMESKDNDIFKEFINQHRSSDGDKGSFMTEEFESFFYDLLQLENWKIYYLESKNSVISTAFCYESENGCYLYNSSRNNQFNHLNPGIVINDMIINNLIEKGKTFFDFLKGTERYKYDLGGVSVQLYDLKIIL